jgi:hypothetical protein
MAEGDGTIYNNFKEQILLGELDLGNAADTIKVMLVTGYTPDIDAHASYSDVSGVEESGTGYVAGGETLANQSVTQDNSNDRAAFDGDNVTWSGLDVGTPSDAIIYDDTHASKYLIAYFEITTASNGGDYTLAWHANGILLLT